MAFHHEKNIEIACNVEAFYLEDDAALAAHPLRDQLIRSFGDCFHVPATVIQQRVQEMAAQEGIRAQPAALVGFSPEEAMHTAIHALTTGQKEFWRTRQTTMM